NASPGGEPPGAPLPAPAPRGRLAGRAEEGEHAGVEGEPDLARRPWGDLEARVHPGDRQVGEALAQDARLDIGGAVEALAASGAGQVEGEARGRAERALGDLPGD